MPRARRRCGTTGCDALATAAGRCDAHRPVPWEGSHRRTSLPSDWSSLRARILERDPTCQLAYVGVWPTSTGEARCLEASSEVDHMGDENDHRDHMLRGVCAACHRRRTQAQSAAARARG